MSGTKNRDFQFDEHSDTLFSAILSLKNPAECEKFFQDVMTISELQAITERFRVARELYTTDKSYRQINQDTGVSTATITRVSQWMKNGLGGYKLVLERLYKSIK